MAHPEPGSGPTVRRILLGYQLRKLREAKGITRADAGYKIRGSESKISRLELGRVGFKLRDVEDLLSLYGVTDPAEREPLITLAKESNKAGWWQQYGDALPNWFQSYVGLEEAATRIRTYEAQFVPGLLQTEAYARSVILGGTRRDADGEAENRVAVRLHRQRRILDNRGVKLWAIVDEAAVRRPVGDAQILKRQLERLVEFCDHPNITLQIIPFSVGAHAAEAGSFTILRYPEYDLADVVYLEQLTGALYLDKPDDVDAYTMAMERLSVAAEPPNQTPKMLADMIADL
ncbi:helix-turn-helix domain-containing protein [Marinitenerispora sediminis]|uniref:Transcriptional regulator n=1 Tax=Marinitenerispora sediminis TaxID=1931232 RepID=A0A368T856_9ACTN|nr:helix-turn-helix transcriptional regulator [Marinitenerispora sediminis]RCV52026.1 transcriptional regulator [Marinitenerispora sediminis]RCV56933.1 transcriptional regulator [Marinitenerispora sediminis]RCV60071.1 transcriptional regulator [Marinitenerispora sediminis]